MLVYQINFTKTRWVIDPNLQYSALYYYLNVYKHLLKAKALSQHTPELSTDFLVYLST